MRLWVILIAGGLITFGIRLFFILAHGRLSMPGWFQHALRFVPAAVLTAVLMPELITWNNKIDLTWQNPQILAGIVATLVAWRTRNVVLTLLSGLACFFILNNMIH